jgi:hypothetical protein
MQKKREKSSRNNPFAPMNRFPIDAAEITRAEIRQLFHPATSSSHSR